MFHFSWWPGRSSSTSRYRFFNNSTNLGRSFMAPRFCVSARDSKRERHKLHVPERWNIGNWNWKCTLVCLNWCSIDARLMVWGGFKCKRKTWGSKPTAKAPIHSLTGVRPNKIIPEEVTVHHFYWSLVVIHGLNSNVCLGVTIVTIRIKNYMC